MEIGQLLDVKLKAFADQNDLSVAYENKKFSNSKKYLEAFLLPAENHLSGINRESESGIYQVNLHYPTGIYRDEVDAMARKLMDYFKTGSMTENYRHFPSTSRTKGIQSATHYSVAVTIHYRRERKL